MLYFNLFFSLDFFKLLVFGFKLLVEGVNLFQTFLQDFVRLQGELLLDGSESCCHLLVDLLFDLVRCQLLCFKVVDDVLRNIV
jgi:hypothetical protein